MSVKHMRWAIVAATAYMIGSGAAAQDGARDEAAAFAALDAAAEEQTPFLICSATTPEAHSVVRQIWREQVERALESLRDSGYGDAFVLAFERRSEDAFRMPSNWSFAEAISYCAEHPDWFRRFNLFGYEPLDHRIKALD